MYPVHTRGPRSTLGARKLLQLGGSAACDWPSHRAQLTPSMNNLLRFSLAAATLSLALTTLAPAAETDAGAVDIGQLMPSAKGEFVEVNLSAAMLKFAARIAARQEPETAELIRNLKS